MKIDKPDEVDEASCDQCSIRARLVNCYECGEERGLLSNYGMLRPVHCRLMRPF